MEELLDGNMLLLSKLIYIVEALETCDDMRWLRKWFKPLRVKPILGLCCYIGKGLPVRGLQKLLQEKKQFLVIFDDLLHPLFHFPLTGPIPISMKQTR